MSGKSKLFLGLGVGIWTGVALGMLIAPKSAKDIRHIAKCLSAALMGRAVSREGSRRGRRVHQVQQSKGQAHRKIGR
jgi:gas vesicle protein